MNFEIFEFFVMSYIFVFVSIALFWVYNDTENNKKNERVHDRIGTILLINFPIVCFSIMFLPK